MTVRAQANVVGVALMMGVTVVALAGITASVGTVVDDVTARGDVNRVASQMDDALRPIETHGTHEGTIRFTDGRVHTVERELRVLDGSAVVATVDVDGLVFSAGDRRVRYVGGALVRGRGDDAWSEQGVPVTASPGSGGVLVVSAAKLNASHTSVSGSSAATTLHTNVTHERRSLGSGAFSVAVETSVPDPLVRDFEADGASVSVRDIDGDGTVSVVARYPGTRDATLVVHDMRLEVGDG
ncbi:type IV pilin [Haloarculaceae archaeon H-GB11]|nr:type IV pilin [Haloarculaceae archaeon H-GB11]